MGTIGQKLDYLSDTKSILKQKINNLGGSLTDQSTFRSYGDYLDTLYDELPKVTGEGTEITLTPTRKGRMQLDLKGNTSQATRILPEGYTQLDYIESTGTQYIDTGRYSTSSTKFEMDYISTKQLGDAFQCLFGSQNSNDTRRVYILLGSTKNNVQLQFPHNDDDPLFMQEDGTFSSTPRNTDVTVNPGEKNKIIFDNINRSVTFGQYTSVSTSTYEILPSNHNILIFARNDNTTPTSNFAIGKLYRFKWYENNVLTMDFVPCKNANNEVGLYDLVSQTFFDNAGTGDFVAGNEVSIPNPDYPQPIHVVTGNNTIEVTGKNIFSGDTLIQVGGTGTKRNGFYVTTPGTYTVSYSNNNSSRYFSFKVIDNGVYGTYSSINSPYTFTISQNQTAIIYIGDENKTFSQQGFYNVQIEQGSTATSYVPYYHADYPIDLRGKNKFNPQKVTPNTYLQNSGNTGASQSSHLADYIMVKAGQVYTISFKYNEIFNPGNRSLCFYNTQKRYISGRYIDINKTITVTPAQDGYIRFAFDKNWYDIQVEEGTETSYEPYNSLELCKIGDYQDYLYKENGNWYKYEAIDKKVLDGTETWRKSDVPGVVKTQRFARDDATAHIANIGYCDKIKVKDAATPMATDIELVQFSTSGGNKYIGIQINIDRLSSNTISAFTEWLTNNNLHIYRALETVTITQITDTTLISQLDAIENAMSTTDTTTISQTNSDLPFIISASALTPFTTETLTTSLTDGE